MLPAGLQEELRSPFELRRHRPRRLGKHGRHVRGFGSAACRGTSFREADIALSAGQASRDNQDRLLMRRAWRARRQNLVSLEGRTCTLRRKKHELQLLFPADRRSADVTRWWGAEALLRWRHPVEGVLAPDRFLGIAEEAGLMATITRWTILRAGKGRGKIGLRASGGPIRISSSASISPRRRCGIPG